jgi:hypothetical protein
MTLHFKGITIKGDEVLFGDDDGILMKWIPLVDYYKILEGNATSRIDIDILGRGTLAGAMGVDPMVLWAYNRDIYKPDTAMRASHDASSYEIAVSAILIDLNKSDTGKAVISATERQQRTLTISPYLITPGIDFNADAFSGFDTVPIDRSCSDKRGLARIREKRSTDAIIRYTPKQWGYEYGPYHHYAYTPDSNKPDGPGFEHDEFLLHEMVHALRKLAGVGNSRWAGRAVPGQLLQANMEEFYAVLIANIYRSEMKRDGLRQYYRIPGSSYTITNKEFLKIERNRMHLRQLRRQQPTLFNALNDIDAPFNPTREFDDA